MADPRFDSLAPLLAATTRQLLDADQVDEVRHAVAHGVRLLSPYDSLTLRERDVAGSPVVTFRAGAELDANAKALERLLSHEAERGDGTTSTLDRFDSAQAQGLAAAYIRRPAVCLTRVLRVFGRQVGLLTLHYEGRLALHEAEFEALRTFSDYAAFALQ